MVENNPLSNRDTRVDHSVYVRLLAVKEPTERVSNAKGAPMTRHPGERHAMTRTPEPERQTMPGDELRRYLRTHHSTSLRPFAGRALGLSRSATYVCPEIRVLRLGHRCRVSSAWLESLLLGDQH